MTKNPQASSDQTTPLLELCSINKQYGEVVAATDIDIQVQEGEFLTLLGPSGSGKTTTLNIIAGFERPTSGHVVIDGIDVTNRPPNKRNLGMVLQGYALFPHMTVRDNVAFPLRARRIPGVHQDLVRDALKMVSLDGYEDRRPRELSGGQQQRVALARSFVASPPVLLMDEPLSALDRALRSKMQAELRRIHRDLGTTVVYVTHDQEEAMSLSDRVAVMHEGRVAQIGTAREVYHSPSTPFVAQFVGKANVVPVRFSDGDDPAQTQSAQAHGGMKIRGRRTWLSRVSNEGLAVLRPEDALVGSSPTDDANVFRVSVKEKVFLGDRLVCRGEFDTGESCEFWLPHGDDASVPLSDLIPVSWKVSETALVDNGGPES